MPLYEFECERCGARFEELVAAGTDSLACAKCGAAETRRVYSAQAASFKLVKSRGKARKQEARNAELKTRTKAAFKERRRKAREAAAAAKSPGGPAGG